MSGLKAPSGRRSALALQLATCVALLGGCGAPPPAPVVVTPRAAPQTVASVAPEVPKGPRAAARVIAEGDPVLQLGLGARPGDLWIANPTLQALIAGPERRLGPSNSGGALLHVEPTEVRAQARLGSLVPVFDAAGQRAPVITGIVIQQDGAVGGPAVIHLEGHDPFDAKIRYAQDVMLAPDADTLQIRATIINESNNYMPEFFFGFLAEWGSLQPFVPGRLPGPAMTSSDWIGASGPVASLVLTLPIGRIDGLHGAGWSVLLPRPVHIRPKQRASSELQIVPGVGGESAAVARIFRSRKAVAGMVSGTVNVPGAEVELLDGVGAAVMRGTADPDGRYAFVTRPGRMSLRARAPGRAAITTGPFYVSGESSAAVPITLGPASGLRFAVRDGQAPVPARITLRAAEGEAVWLSAVKGAIRAGDTLVSLTGSGEAPLPPGRYTVDVDAGPLYPRIRREVNVQPGAIAALEVPLSPEIEARGRFALDAEVLAPPGNDGIIVRAADCAAAGIDGVVLLGDGAVPPGVERPIIFRGMALADPGVGWFAGFPLDGPPPAQPVRARAAERLAALRAMPGALAAVLRPRSPGWAYLETFNFEPRAKALPRGGFSLDFDLLQVVTPAGGAPAVEKALGDYLGLLKRGQHVVPIGGSGARYRASRCGVGRTWLPRAPADAAALRTALRSGDVVASFGPILDLTVDGARAGSAIAPAASHTVTVGIDASAAHRPVRLRIFADGTLAAEKRLSASGALSTTVSLKIEGPARTVVAVVDSATNPAAFAVTGPVRIGAR